MNPEDFKDIGENADNLYKLYKDEYEENCILTTILVSAIGFDEAYGDEGCLGLMDHVEKLKGKEAFDVDKVIRDMKDEVKRVKEEDGN